MKMLGRKLQKKQINFLVSQKECWLILDHRDIIILRENSNSEFYKTFCADYFFPDYNRFWGVPILTKLLL